MISLTVAVPIDYNESDLTEKIKRELGVSRREIKSVKILKRSVDARKELRYSLNVAVQLEDESRFQNKLYVEPKKYIPDERDRGKRKAVVVGSGPAGIFSALTLAKAGVCPIIIERGKPVRERKKDVLVFQSDGELNEESNVQFGEGGAGTFSDGKLNTGINDERIDYVFNTYVSHGAPEDILIDGKPHIGTDKLIGIAENLRRTVESLGGKFFFSAKRADINVRNGKLVSVTVERNGETEEIETDYLVLATGHSARDTYEMLVNRGVAMIKKPFSVGVRIEHLQKEINLSQYRNADFTATYKLSHHLKNGRGVYTFCTCPGGYVISAASEKGGIAINGMSEYKRDAENTNSAILVGVNPEDVGEEVLSGIEFQRKYERLADDLTSSYRAPAQKFSDFVKNKETKAFGKITPSYLPSVVPSNLNLCLPEFVSEGLKAGITEFGKKLKGFDDNDAVLTGVETRSSAPVRILRNERHESVNVKGLFPTGEGAGYAGGITSSAVDGIKTAENILKIIDGE